jgi:hypothetical protein
MDNGHGPPYLPNGHRTSQVMGSGYTGPGGPPNGGPPAAFLPPGGGGPPVKQPSAVFPPAKPSPSQLLPDEPEIQTIRNAAVARKSYLLLRPVLWMRKHKKLKFGRLWDYCPDPGQDYYSAKICLCENFLMNPKNSVASQLVGTYFW